MGNAEDLISRRAAIDKLKSKIDKKAKGEIGTFYNTVILKDIESLESLPSVRVDHITEKALRLLLEWAIECGFGYDNLGDLYDKYKNDIESMDYSDGLIHIAKMEVLKDG